MIFLLNYSKHKNQVRRSLRFSIIFWINHLRSTFRSGHVHVHVLLDDFQWSECFHNDQQVINSNWLVTWRSYLQVLCYTYKTMWCVHFTTAKNMKLEIVKESNHLSWRDLRLYDLLSIGGARNTCHNNNRLTKYSDI